MNEKTIPSLEEQNKINKSREEYKKRAKEKADFFNEHTSWPGKTPDTAASIMEEDALAEDMTRYLEKKNNNKKLENNEKESRPSLEQLDKKLKKQEKMINELINILEEYANNIAPITDKDHFTGEPSGIFLDKIQEFKEKNELITKKSE